MKKMTALLTALVMASASMMHVSADAYALGDVDMDGIITGHDTAMVSRYLQEEAYTLTEEQLTLADINADGTVDQADADMMYATQEYPMGAVGALNDSSGRKYINLDDAQDIMVHYALSAVGKESDLTAVQRNMSDLDLDGDVDLDDVRFALTIFARVAAALESPFMANGVYYFSTYPESPAYGA
ncbi:MAG: dockerin type I repeat-containing protein [Ruminococcus sp.]|nr:dockerin type I repeat-containing protein [Ruminococcus sp.]